MKSMKVTKGDIGSLDRISELPEFILHLILSFLPTKKAYRTSILSKKWYNAWASIPILDFQPGFFKMEHSNNDKERVQFYVEFIDKTMQRYSIRKHFIERLHLEFPDVSLDFSPLIDKWVGIAVECQIEELKIDMNLLGSPKDKLPEILFLANSLKALECEYVVHPYYRTMKLHSLTCLKLSRVNVNEPMLEQILASCPLIDIELKLCTGLENVSIPWISNDDHDIKQSNLEKFVYFSSSDSSWPFNMIVRLLKNLRKLELYNASTTDEIVSMFALELVSLEELSLLSCFMLKNVVVSSKTIKKLFIVECFELEKVMIDAPNLFEFWYNGDPDPSLCVINAQVHCDTHFYVVSEFLSVDWFLTLNEFLLKSNVFKALEINLVDCTSEQIENEKDVLKQIAIGQAYKLKELNLHETNEWDLTYSSISTFFDGIFQSCRPDFLTILTTTNFQNESVQNILESLKEKVKCWRHPLKNIEVENVDLGLFNLLWRSELKIRLKLSW